MAQEHLFVLNVVANGPETAADIAPHARVDHRHAPIFFARAKHLNLRAFDDAIAVGLRFIVKEEVLYRVGLVAEAEHEILVPVLAIIVHHMPKDRLMADRDHRFRHTFGILADARTETAAE